MASRRAKTSARLGLSIARRFGEVVRREEVLVERSTETDRRLAPVGFSTAASPPQPHSFFVEEDPVEEVVAAALRAISARFRSLVVSADLPRRESASRRASTSSRLG